MLLNSFRPARPGQVSRRVSFLSLTFGLASAVYSTALKNTYGLDELKIGLCYLYVKFIVLYPPASRRFIRGVIRLLIPTRSFMNSHLPTMPTVPVVPAVPAVPAASAMAPPGARADPVQSFWNRHDLLGAHQRSADRLLLPPGGASCRRGLPEEGGGVQAGNYKV
jgi:hypothetical protein